MSTKFKKDDYRNFVDQKFFKARKKDENISARRKRLVGLNENFVDLNLCFY
jgi:hypothetical protein